MRRLLVGALLLTGCVTFTPPPMVKPTVAPAPFLPTEAGKFFADSVALCRGYNRSLIAFAGDVDRSHQSHAKQAFAWGIASGGVGVIDTGLGAFYNTDTSKYSDAAAITTLVGGIITAVFAIPAAIAGNNATSQGDQMTAARAAVQNISDLVSTATQKVATDTIGKSDDDKKRIAFTIGTQLVDDCTKAATAEQVPTVPESASPAKVQELIKAGNLDELQRLIRQGRHGD